MLSKLVFLPTFSFKSGKHFDVQTFSEISISISIFINVVHRIIGFPLLRSHTDYQVVGRTEHCN